MKNLILLSKLTIPLLLVFATVLPAQAQFSGDGDGTETSPYIITNLGQLQEMALNLDAHFILGNDIDASDTENWNDGQGFEPAGTEESPFTGSLEGDNYEITELTIDRPVTENVGLFGWIEADVHNLNLADVSITGSTRVGGLVGRIEDGAVSNVSVTGEVTGNLNSGGLVGVHLYGTIDQSHADVTVTGNQQTGGFSAFITEDAVVTNSFATGDVTNTGPSAGGFTGIIGGDVENVYSTGSVSGGNITGGLVGSFSGGSLTAAYTISEVSGDGDTGAFLGTMGSSSELSFGYWNSEINDDLSAGGSDDLDDATGLNTEEMTGEEAFSNFAGFDFQDGWLLTESYPALEWEDVDALDLPDADQPDQISLDSPADMSDDIELQALLSWQSDDNSSAYRVEVAEDSDFEEIIRTREGTSTNLQFDTELEWATTYYWRVRGENNLGDEGDWSDTWSFTIENAPYAGGSGTEEDPYQIETITQLQAINLIDRDKHFIQVSDIDAADTENWNDGSGFEPIGDFDNTFSGSYDGDGHVISGLYINRDEMPIVGLFGKTTAEFIRDLGLTDVDITGNLDVGGLAGVNSGVVTKSFVEGIVRGNTRVGGLLGQSYEEGHISESYSKGNVEGVGDNRAQIGGLIGATFGETVIEFSYSHASVSGANLVGGVAGYHTSGTITHTYASGIIESSGVNRGALAGLNNATYTNSYWDNENSEQSAPFTGSIPEDSDNIIGLETDQMIDQEAFLNMPEFDFEEKWLLTEGYPALYWEDVDALDEPELDVPEMAVLSYPVEDSDDIAIQPEFTWEEAELASGYQIQISTDEDFDSLIEDETLTDTSFSTTESFLDYNTPYFWRVRGTNRAGEGEWATGSFTTLESPFPAGDGSEESPFQVENVEQLQEIVRLEDHYIQVDDIDAEETESWNEGTGFHPIGTTSAPFSGTYNGDGYEITDLTIQRNLSNQGLFGLIHDGLIKNVTVINAEISGGNNVGVLSGQNNGVISQSQTTGTVNGAQNVGGMAGQNSGEIQQSHSAVEVTGDSGNEWRVGGLVGLNSDGIISDSYANGSVTGESETGGLVGWNNTDGMISHSYATGDVSGSSTYGGLIGFNSATVDSCYWDTETSGQSAGFGGQGSDASSEGVAGLTTAEMQGPDAEDNMPGLTFGQVWAAEDDVYPALLWSIRSEMVVLSSPGDEEDQVDRKPTFEWEELIYSDAYHIQVSDSDGFSDLILNKEAIESTVFEVSDEELEAETSHYWRVRAVNEAGKSEWSETRSFTTGQTATSGSEDLADQPQSYELNQNYPNPFNPTTQITFAIPEDTHVTLEVYDALGQRVATLVDEPKNIGYYEYQFDGSDLASGVYLYRLQTDSFSKTQQMMFVK